MINRSVRFTYQDYVNLPESEERRYELVDGDLCMVPAPTPLHQAVVLRLVRIFDDFVSTRALGRVYMAPLDVVLSSEDVLQPDILFISTARLAIVEERDVRGAPDLVIEVLSPGTAGRDRTVKRSRYLRFGVCEYWLVDPQTRTVEVLRAGQTAFETVRVYPVGTVATSPLLEGVAVDVGALFA